MQQHITLTPFADRSGQLAVHISAEIDEFGVATPGVRIGTITPLLAFDERDDEHPTPEWLFVDADDNDIGDGTDFRGNLDALVAAHQERQARQARADASQDEEPPEEPREREICDALEEDGRPVAFYGHTGERARIA